MLTCTKTYFDVPFAHRQHLHDGHCSYVHGHNWDISITFACEETDENGFVVDFGKVKFLKEWIEKNLDHACVFANDDPVAEKLRAAAPEAWKIYLVDQCSCEGLARHLFKIFNEMVMEKTADRVRVLCVQISEDKKNAARYSEDEDIRMMP